jgi:hypothetical protein
MCNDESVNELFRPDVVIRDKNAAVMKFIWRLYFRSLVILLWNNRTRYFIFLMNSSTGRAGSVVIWTEPRAPISTDIFMTVSLFGASTMFKKS